MFIFNLEITSVIFVLVKLSFFVSILGCLIRLVTFGNFQIWRKCEKPLFSYLVRNKLFFHLLQFCYTITERVFTYKYEFIRKFVIIASGCLLGFGFGVRVAIIGGIFIPYQKLMLLLFAVNAVFRSIIHLGILLRSGGGSLWRLLLERSGRSASRFVPTIQSTSSPENQNNSNNSGENKNSENTKKEEQSTINWSKWSAIGTGIGAAFSMLTFIVSVGDARELGEKTAKIRSMEDDKIRDNNQKEDLQKHNQDLQKHNQDLQKHNQDLYTENTNLKGDILKLEQENNKFNQRIQNLEEIAKNNGKL